MKNETNLFKRIRNIIVGNTLPKNEDLWIDTSNGEKNAVLKYKGNPLGGGSGSGSSSDYQSSGSIVKDMIEQGSNFNWAKYAIDIPSLPCFDQSKIESLSADKVLVMSILADGYSLVGASLSARESVIFVVKVTGDNPSARYTASGPDPVASDFTFMDCEPVEISSLSAYDMSGTQLVPARVIQAEQNDNNELVVDSSSVFEYMVGSGLSGGIPVFPLLVVGYIEAFG